MTDWLTSTSVTPHSSGLPAARNPAPSQARFVRSQLLAAEMSSGQASAGVSPKPFMIESPIVSTCLGAAAGTGAGGVAEGVAVGLGVAVLSAGAEAGGLLFGLDNAEGLVSVDRAPAAEFVTTPVMREQQAMVATEMVMPSNQLRDAEIDIGLPSVRQAVRSSQAAYFIVHAKFWY